MLGFGVVSELWKNSELRRSVNNLVTKTLEADMQMLQNSAELSYRLMRCGLQSGFRSGKTDAEGAVATTAVIKDLIQLNVDYYSTLVDLNLAFTNRLLDTFKDREVPSPTSQSASEPPTMKLAADVGDRIRAPFRVENNRSVSTTVTFHLTAFVRDDKSQSVQSGVTFDPPEIELQPHQEEQIFLELPVTQEFEPGHSYTAMLSVEGMDSMQIRIRLEVRATASQTPPR